MCIQEARWGGMLNQKAVSASSERVIREGIMVHLDAPDCQV